MNKLNLMNTHDNIHDSFPLSQAERRRLSWHLVNLTRARMEVFQSNSKELVVSKINTVRI